MGVRDPITIGVDSNFFQKVTVTSAVFVNDCDILMNIKGVQSFYLINAGAGDVEYSFNGNTLHGELRVGQPDQSMFFDNRVASKIWFRLTAGASAVISVGSWRHP